MADAVHYRRLGSSAVAAGALAGVAAFAAQPAFERYVSGVLGGLSLLVPLEPRAPALAASLAVAFLVGVSMNVLPCNLPVVMSLLPATSGASSRAAFARRTVGYALGAVAALGTIGFALGAAGGAVRPLVLGYPAVGVYVAGAVVGVVGLVSVLWGLREVGLVSLSGPSLPMLDALRADVDRRSGRGEYVLLGAVYAGTSGGCPMPTYHLLLVWVTVAADPWFGATVLGTYVLGRVLPVAALGAVFHERPTRAAGLLRRQYPRVRALNGVVLLSLGSLLLVFVGLRALATVV